MALNRFPIGILLGLDDQASGPLGGLNKRFGEFAKTLPPGLQGIGKFAAALGPMAIAAGAVAIAVAKLTKTIIEATKVAIEFESQMAEVSTLLNDQQQKLMPELEAGVRDLSIQYGKSTDDMTRGLYQTVSAGVDAGEALRFMNISGGLALGGVTDMETAVDGLTSVMNAYGLTIDEMSTVSDQFFVAMKAGKTTIGELSSSIGQVAPIASSMGIGIEEVLAITATLTKQGLGTSEAITGIRQSMVEVLRQTPKFAKAVKKYGIDARQSTVQQMGFANWLAMANTQITAQGGKLTELFRSVEGLNAVMALTGKGMADNVSIMEQMRNAAGATEDAVSKMQRTVKVQQAAATAAQQAFMQELGEIFLPAAKGIASVRMRIFQAMREMLGKFKTRFVAPLITTLEPFIRILRFVIKIVAVQWVAGFKLAWRFIRPFFKGFILPIKAISLILRFIITQIEKLPGVFERIVSWMAGWGSWMSQIWKFVQRIRIEFSFLTDQAKILGELAVAVASGEGKRVAELTAESIGRVAQRGAEIAGLEARRVQFQKDLETGFLTAMKKRDEEREAAGKDKQTTNIQTTVNIGDEKVGEKIQSWEEEFIIRDLEPVF